MATAATSLTKSRAMRARLRGVAISALLGAFLWNGALPAQTARIVGIGAVSCRHYMDEAIASPEIEKNMFAWAQGHMSGLLLRAPPGMDEGVDLMPPSFPLMRQVEFLRNYCTRNPNADFADGVAELYKTLRAPPT